jgi:general stress protein YciG
MAITTVNGGPRYTYEQPTEKAQHGLPPNLGHKINNYKLPAIDVDESRRNFDGYQVEQFFTMADLQGGDEAGTTDTDYITHKGGNNSYSSYNGDRSGYTNINRKSGKGGRGWKASSPR